MKERFHIPFSQTFFLSLSLPPLSLVLPCVSIDSVRSLFLCLFVSLSVYFFSQCVSVCSSVFLPLPYLRLKDHAHVVHPGRMAWVTGVLTTLQPTRHTIRRLWVGSPSTRSRSCTCSQGRQHPFGLRLPEAVGLGWRYGTLDYVVAPYNVLFTPHRVKPQKKKRWTLSVWWSTTTKYI